MDVGRWKGPEIKSKLEKFFSEFELGEAQNTNQNSSLQASTPPEEPLKFNPPNPLNKKGHEKCLEDETEMTINETTVDYTAREIMNIE